MDERDTKGRFAPGNKGGPGNTTGSKVQKLRYALINSITERDIKRVAAAVLAAALGTPAVIVDGKIVAPAVAPDMQAAKLLLAYAVGQPQAAPVEDSDGRAGPDPERDIKRVAAAVLQAALGTPAERDERGNVLVPAVQPDMQAAKLLLSYAVGQPQAAPVEDCDGRGGPDPERDARALAAIRGIVAPPDGTG